MKWRWWRTANEMAEDFASNRCIEADAKFIADCGLPDTLAATHAALAVRRSVAAVGMIESDFIRAADTYPDQLIELSGWDSLDFLAWIFELERELGRKITSEAFKDIHQSFSVADLAQAAYAVVAQDAGHNATQQ